MLSNPTAAGVVVISKDRKRILALRDLRKNPDGYGLPCGKANFGESPMAAAVRECREETGLFPLGLEPLFEAESEGFWCYAFLVKDTSGVMQTLDEGTPEWVTPRQFVMGRYAAYNLGVVEKLRHRGLLDEAAEF